jgi:hypothetical protein
MTGINVGKNSFVLKRESSELLPASLADIGFGYNIKITEIGKTVISRYPEIKVNFGR